MRFARAASIVALAVLLSGCFSRPETHCIGCALVYWQDPDPPPVPPGKTALVILLHGAFGFGAEWDPIQVALRMRPELAFWAFAWPGPFGGRPPNRAESFRRALQMSLSGLPPSVHEVLILAHSAGGPIADYAARRIVLPADVHLHVVLLDPSHMSMAPYTMVESIDTPLGLSVGAVETPLPPLAPGVDVIEYRASDPPRRGAMDPNIRYLGRKVTHGQSVGLGGLSHIESLPRP